MSTIEQITEASPLWHFSGSQFEHLKDTSRNSCASEGVFEMAKTDVLLPWNAATIFSAGITYKMSKPTKNQDLKK